jgi:hypothetical protein
MVVLNSNKKKILKKIAIKKLQIKHNQTFAKKRIINLMKKRVIT